LRESDILSRINIYKYVRLVELEEHERADLTERQGNGGSTDEPDPSSAGPREAKSNSQGPNEQPRDVTVLQRNNAAKFDWRVDLKDNHYRYDRLVEPVQTPNREGGDIQPHGTCSLYGC